MGENASALRSAHSRIGTIAMSIELGIAPVLGLSQANHVRLVDRLGLAADHLLYVLVLSATRARPRKGRPQGLCAPHNSQGAYPPRMIDPLALLEATDQRGQNTTPEIAAILDVSENEAEQVLRQAERDGLVHEETDESRNVAPDFNRQVWFLTDAGREKRDRLRVIP